MRIRNHKEIEELRAAAVRNGYTGEACQSETCGSMRVVATQKYRTCTACGTIQQ